MCGNEVCGNVTVMGRWGKRPSVVPKMDSVFGIGGRAPSGNGDVVAEFVNGGNVDVVGEEEEGGNSGRVDAER